MKLHVLHTVPTELFGNPTVRGLIKTLAAESCDNRPREAPRASHSVDGFVRESDRSRTDKDLDSGKRKAVTIRDHVKPHVLHTVPTELFED